VLPPVGRPAPQLQRRVARHPSVRITPGVREHVQRRPRQHLLQGYRASGLQRLLVVGAQLCSASWDREAGTAVRQQLRMSSRKYAAARCRVLQATQCRGVQVPLLLQALLHPSSANPGRVLSGFIATPATALKYVLR
jgi:hypothetical protein